MDGVETDGHDSGSDARTTGATTADWSRAMAAVGRGWRRLDHDWQAIVLGAVVVVAVVAGVSIPW